MKSKVGVGALVVLVVGCASLSEEGKGVKIADPSEIAVIKKECKEIGLTFGSSEEGQWAALIDMKNNAAKAKMNVVVSKLQYEQIVGWLSPNNIVKGTGFHCPAPIQAKLQNAEHL